MHQECNALFQDKTLTCRDCGREFVFTAGEQQFYQSRGLMNEPGPLPGVPRGPQVGRRRRGRRRLRLLDAAAAAAAATAAAAAAAAATTGPRREMFPATCSSCGKETKVPFQPRGDKPVYCSECFETVRGGWYR